MKLSLTLRLCIMIIIATFPSTTTVATSSQEQRWVNAVRNVYGERAAQRVRTWRNEIHQLFSLPERKKLEQVVSNLNLMVKTSQTEQIVTSTLMTLKTLMQMILITLQINQDLMKYKKQKSFLDLLTHQQKKR